MVNSNSSTARSADYHFDVPDELRSLLPGFIIRRQEEVKQLETLLSQDNFTAIAQIGHKLKGHGASYGFEDISLWGHELETAAQLKNKNELALILQKYDELVEIISKLVPRNTLRDSSS